jgi:hypothetical protein
MAETIDALRAKARAHQQRLDAEARFLSVQDLAARWGVCDATVRAIPADRLPYTAVGGGTRRTHRRYNPADVARYEHGQGAAA